MKDYFSGHSKLYATFRPTYPQEMYQFILNLTQGRERAWDCGTGNGQAARVLAKSFEHVDATDISARQLEEAHPADNISYSIASAENPPFDDHQFDLITVGQALHWFDRPAFYKQVNRVGKQGATIAVWGYATLSVSEEIDPILMHFYNDIVGPYWDNARRLVEDEYSSIEFPFKDVQKERFHIRVSWTLPELTGYLESWSATQKYIKTHQHNPVTEVARKLNSLWTEHERKTVVFPVFVLLGKI